MKNLLHILLIAALSVGSLYGCIDNRLLGSGTPRTISQDLSSFNTVAIYDEFDFTFIENNSRPIPVVNVTLDDNLTQFVQLQVVQGELSVRLLRPLSTVKRTLEIEGPALAGIRLFGRSKGRIGQMNSRLPVTIEVNAFSTLDIDSLEADNATIIVRDQSSLTITGGAVANVTTQVYNQSHFNAEAMRVNTMEATISNQSRANVNVISQLGANLSGSSELNYKGNAQINQNIVDRESHLRPVQ